MKDVYAVLYPDQFYHVYNRANGEDKLFRNKDNFSFFLSKYKQYIFPLAGLYAYCLMPNHFHFVVKIKSGKDIEDLILVHNEKVKYNKTLRGFQTLKGLERHKAISSFITLQWSHFFNSYTQAFNKMNNRKGSLFMRNFKRKNIYDETYLKKLIHYIHFNPVNAGMVSEPKDWKFSSYQSILSKKSTKLIREEVIELFDDLENFKFCHQYPPDITGINHRI